jgi:nitroreductase
MSSAIAEARIPEYEIATQFIERWSPRSFTGEAISEATLFSFFEAARWAPSASNEQPWRFIYSLRDSDSWDSFTGLLSENNRLWGQNAAALVVIVSKATRISRETGEVIKSRSHSFDTGAAWANFALQASLSGWATHAIGGFDKEKAREGLRIPADYHIEAAVAIGRRGEKASLPATLQQRENPNGRLPLNQIVFQNAFKPAP